MPPLISNFSALAPGYDVLLCDIWGVVHNGLSVHPHACDALMRARARGATVILVTNAPRPSEQVSRQLDRLLDGGHATVSQSCSPAMASRIGGA